MSVQYFENEKIFMLQGRKSTYAFEIQDGGAVCNLHWGGKVNDVIDLPTTEELVNHISTGPFSQVNTGNYQKRPSCCGNEKGFVGQRRYAVFYD